MIDWECGFTPVSYCQSRADKADLLGEIKLWSNEPISV